MQHKINEISISYQEGIRSPFWTKIKSSKDAAELLHDYWDKNTIGLHESFKIILLNNDNKVKGIYQLSKGGITGTTIDLRILFAVILKTLAVAIVIAHNHPSNSLRPSANDKEITNKIKKAAKLFDVTLLDHIIIAPSGDYYSFADNGIL